jgi:hypothetical protein
MWGAADLNQEQVDQPTCWCDTGHCARGMWKRGGPDAELEPIRFFRVSGLGINGIYCEPCLTIVHWMVRERKKT